MKTETLLPPASLLCHNFGTRSTGGGRPHDLPCQFGELLRFSVVLSDVFRPPGWQPRRVPRLGKQLQHQEMVAAHRGLRQAPEEVRQHRRHPVERVQHVGRGERRGAVGEEEERRWQQAPSLSVGRGNVEL